MMTAEEYNDKPTGSNDGRTNPVTDLIRRADAIAACQVGPSDEWSRSTKSGYSQAATDCAMNVLRVPAAQVADRAQIRADALREAAGMIGRIAKGYEDGGDGAIACGLYLTEGNVRALIDTPPAVSDVAALVDAASQYLGTIDATNSTVTSQGMALYDLHAALAKMKGGVK